jgi:hypothetical protein
MALTEFQYEAIGPDEQKTGGTLYARDRAQSFRPRSLPMHVTPIGAAVEVHSAPSAALLGP